MKPIIYLTAALACALTAQAQAQNVTTYHNGIKRPGAYRVPSLTIAAAANIHPDTSFNGAVTGNVYAQPLYWHQAGKPGEVIVATESNVVEALNADTGAVIWQTNLGTPVPNSALPCGNINPEGVTGTPAIDAATSTIFLDAMVSTAKNGPRHMLFALNVDTGAVQPNYPIDVQASLASAGHTLDSLTQGQRSALLFWNGNLYIPYAGRSGDCGTYYGTVVQVAGPTGAIGGFWATRARGGGIWSQGGIAAGGKYLYTTTGNTFGASTWNDGEAIIRLQTGLARSGKTVDYYTPSDWSTLDADDADLGGTEAIPIEVPVAGHGSAERVLALGKDGNAYLTNAANLGGIGGELAKVSVSNSEIITAPAVYATSSTTMVAFRNANGKTCGGGSISMLQIQPASLSEAWCAALNGGGAPIITTTDGVQNPIVWAVGAGGDNLLHGFDALTGTVVFSGTGTSMSGLRNFATILVGGGKFYVAGQGKIYAFTY